MNTTSAELKKTLALQTFTKLLRAAETVAGEVHAHLADHNLTVSQFGVLEALHHLGPMCQKDIAAKILKSSGNITLVIDNLAKHKLVARKRNEHDRRYFTIALTKTGKKLIEDIFPRHANIISEKMAVLDEEEQRILEKLCGKFKKLKLQKKEAEETAERYAITKPTRIYHD